MESERDAATGAQAWSGAAAQALAARLEGRNAHCSERDLSDEERAELEPLLQLADRLDARMKPLRPPAAFAQSLREELVREAKRRMAKREKRHRIAMISAAVAGGVVSLASLVGGIFVLVRWLRTRDDARQASTA